MSEIDKTKVDDSELETEDSNSEKESLKERLERESLGDFNDSTTWRVL